MAQTPHSAGRIPKPGIAPSASRSPLGTQVPTRLRLLPCTRLHVVLSLQPDCRKAILLVFRSFSERVALYVAVAWMCSWGQVSSGSPSSTFWIPPPRHIRTSQILWFSEHRVRSFPGQLGKNVCFLISKTKIPSFFLFPRPTTLR